MDKTKLLTSVAQVFDERGEGIVVRGGAARIDKSDRQPHVDEIGATQLLINALDAYDREHHTSPARVVLHKTSLFNAAEEEGFRAAAATRRVYSLDMITLQDSSTRLFRVGLYPPLRGTLLTTGDKTQLIYTKGSVDFFSTYPGMYAPQALGIYLHSVEQAPRFLAHEVLELTKMNWNNTQFDGSEPITIRAARQVGKILKHVPEGGYIQHRYSYYM